MPDNNDLQEIYARADCRLSIPALYEKGACFLVGDLYRSRGAFVLSNEDQSFIVEPLKIRLKEHAMPFTCAISMQSQVLQQLVAQQILVPDLTGNMTLTLMGDLLNIGAGLQGNQANGEGYYGG